MRAVAFTLFAAAVLLNSFAGVRAADRGWWPVTAGCFLAYAVSAYFCYRCIRLPRDPGPRRLSVK